MDHVSTLLDRNRNFSETFTPDSMSPLPRLGTIILTCIDARVDPAHVLGLELGDAVVFRNNGGRVTRAFIDELSALAIMVARMTGADEARFNIVLMQHTRCGAQSFADPAFRTLIRDRTGIDVADSAISDQKNDLLIDIERLRDAPHLPGAVTVSALLYDVETGTAREIAAAKSLASLRG